MDKKTYVIKVLELMTDSMPLADGLIYLINQYGVSEDLLNILIKSFETSLKDMEDDQLKLKLEKSKTFLEELKIQEFDEQIKDKEDLDRLDQMLKDI